MTDEPTVFNPTDYGEKPSLHIWKNAPSEAWDNAFTPSLSIGFNNDVIVTFRPDGTVEVNPKYSSTEAAQAFWDAVRRIKGMI